LGEGGWKNLLAIDTKGDKRPFGCEATTPVEKPFRGGPRGGGGHAGGGDPGKKRGDGRQKKKNAGANQTPGKKRKGD